MLYINITCPLMLLCNQDFQLCLFSDKCPRELVSILCLYFQPVSNADFIVPVEIDGTIHQVSLPHNNRYHGYNKQINNLLP